MRLFALVLVSLAGLAARDLHACSCAPPKPAKAELARADLVFRAKVVAIDSLEAPGATATDPGGKLRVKFEVEQVWKGDLEASFALNATSPHVGMCEYPWEVGKTYMVYAHGKGENASTSLCSRTHQVGADKLDADAKVLGKARAPKRVTP